MSQQQSADEVPVRDGMPMFGLGTWENDDQQQVADSVQTALEMGYRHIDTAQIYGNEEGVGDGIAAADVPREDVFLASKVWISKLGHDDVISSTKESLQKLGTDYVDLMYVHWPAGAYDAEETLSAFAELKQEGHIERIGVSNFEPEHLDAAREVLGDDVFVNQVEMHPRLRQEALRDYCADADVELVAYSPLARGGVFDMPTVSEIADKHGVSEPQVSLAWLRQKGVTAIPKATSQSHIRDNWESLELELDEADIEAIDAIDETERCVNPDFGPDSWA